MTRDDRDIKPPRWLKPMNRVLILLRRIGLAPRGIHLLTVPGRTSGKPRTTPITPMTFAGARYVVGGFPNADWVLNARAAGRGVLAAGRRKRPVRLVELSPEEARPVLRAFPVEVPTGIAFMKDAGLVHSAAPEEFEALAGRCAVFRMDPLP